MDEQKQKMSLKQRSLKTTKIVAVAAAAVVGLVVVLVALLMLQPVRDGILSFALPRAQRALPGALAIQSARWTSPGSFRFDGVTWTDGPDTLAAVKSLRVSADLLALVRRDVYVKELVLDNACADIPSILKRFPPSGQSESKASSGDPGFPRAGSVPFIPSIAVEHLNVSARHVGLSESFVLQDVVIRAGADLRRGEVPEVTVTRLTLSNSVSGASIDSLWFTANLLTFDFDGNGTINIPDADPWHLVCRSDPDHRFAIHLTTIPGAAPPEVAGISFEGQAHLGPNGTRLEAADFELKFRTPGTDELLRIGSLERILSEPLSKLSPLDALTGTVGGMVHLQPEVSFEATLDLNRNAWLDTVHAIASYTNRTVVVSDFEVGAPGLDIRASSEIPSSGGSVTVRLAVTSSEWLPRVVPDASLPDSTRANLTIEAKGLSGNSAMDLSLRGNAVVAGTAIDTIDVTTTISPENNKSSVTDLLIAAMGTSLATHAQIHASPVVDIVFTQSTIHRGDNELSGGVSYNLDDRSLRVEDLQLTGSLGDYTVDASLDSVQRGSFAAAILWTTPPPFLLDKLHADSAALAEADSAWRADGPFHIRVDGDIAGREGTSPPALSALADLRLPGPRDLAPLLGTDIADDDLGPVEGSVEVTTGVRSAVNACDSTLSFKVRLDLGRTSWLDTALVDVAGCGTAVEIDSVMISFEHVRFAAKGVRAASGQLDILAYLAVADSLILKRFLPGPDIPSVSADATVHLAGSADAPQIAAELNASLRTTDVYVPHITTTADLNGEQLSARIDLPHGAHGFGVVMDSVSLTHSGFIGDTLSGETSFTARGPDTYALFAMHWEKNDDLTVRGDTLYFTMMDKVLESKHPFRVSVSPDGAARIEGLAFQGSLGRVTADGYTSPDSADLDAEVIIHTPRKPGFLDIADRLWPDSLVIKANVDGPTRFHVGAVVEGVEIAGDTPVRAVLAFHATPDSTSAGVTVDSPDKRLLDISGFLPTYRLGDKLSEGPVVLDVHINRLPLPASHQSLTADKPEVLGWLDGRVAVRGTVSDPCALAAVSCDFAATAAGNELGKYRLNIEGQLTGNAAMDTALVAIARQWFDSDAPVSTSTPGLSANLSLTKTGNPALTGVLFYPLKVTLAPYSLEVSGKSDMNFEFETGAVALTDFDPLLPPDIDLEGTCNFQFSATGPTENPSLNGSFRTSAFKIASAKGAQITPDVNIDLGGTAARPSVKGRVKVRSGFIRVPEQQTQLHPREGTSLLWEAADSARNADDGTVAAGDSLDIPEFDSGLDLDVSVEIPGSFRIIGSRMNVELSGDLHLVQQGEHAVLTGQLTPLGGQLLFMGRTFEMRRGNVNFYGGDELNPSLDLTLVSEVAGYRIEIRLTGSLKDPEIALTSDPQLAESDIMSLLVFGKPMGELNTSQSGLVQQRTAEILMVYGAVKLQEQMSQQMGVDIITIQQSTRKPDESALVVGKYLNSRTLVKYEQNLENTGAFLINLEYILTQRLKLETFVDQASTTGVELNWSKDY